MVPRVSVLLVALTGCGGGARTDPAAMPPFTFSTTKLETQPVADAEKGPAREPTGVEGIFKIGPTAYVVARSALAKLEQVSTGQGVYSKPETENGVVVGLRLSGIQPGSVAAAFGLQNGDRIDKLNGYDVTQLQKIVAVAASARGGSVRQLVFSITRNGRGLDLTIDIEE
jgi:general secretion pathway protein C